MKFFVLVFGLTTSLLTLTGCFSGSSSADDSPTTQLPKEDSSQAEPDPSITPLPVPSPSLLSDWADLKSLEVNCGHQTLPLGSMVNQIARQLVQDSLLYNSAPLSDCSGIFHRVLDSLERRCPDQPYPDAALFRSSRALARWYHDQNKLIRIKNALEMDPYIKPGAVMFYGPRNSKLDSVALPALFKSGGINHVGVVVTVSRDQTGRVASYSLFHGRSPGKLASITNWHRRSYRNRPQYPPYGNGTEQWVAVAPILPLAH